MSDRKRLAAILAAVLTRDLITPEQFATLIKDDLPKWAKIVKDSGAKNVVIGLRPGSATA